MIAASVTFLGLSSPALAKTKAELRVATTPDGRQGQTEHAALAIQTALDRARFSPGPMDGKIGANTRKAIAAFQRSRALPETGKPDDQLRTALGVAAETSPLVEYVISQADVAGPFEPDIPEKLEDKAKLERLSYTSAGELLGEKFHISVEALKGLNPGKPLDKSGTQIQVPRIERGRAIKAARLEVDKQIGGVLVYGRNNAMIAFFPATIGSQETPSPTGIAKVTRIARNPTYTYDPAKLNFKGVNATEKLVIKPGPNNPVGLVWIALNQPGYGIHGSPEPSAISRQNSHGCVRLTNWDALDLAGMVSPGTPVVFKDGAERDFSRDDEQPAATADEISPR